MVLFQITTRLKIASGWRYLAAVSFNFLVLVLFLLKRLFSFLLWENGPASQIDDDGVRMMRIVYCYCNASDDGWMDELSLGGKAFSSFISCEFQLGRPSVCLSARWSILFLSYLLCNEFISNVVQDDEKLVIRCLVL